MGQSSNHEVASEPFEINPRNKGESRIQAIGEGNQMEWDRSSYQHDSRHFLFREIDEVFLLANSIRNASTRSGNSVSTVVWAAADVDPNEMFVWERFRFAYLFSKLNILLSYIFIARNFSRCRRVLPFIDAQFVHANATCARSSIKRHRS